MAAGNIKIQANDTRIYTLTPEDGAAGNVDLTIPKDGGKLATNVYQSIAASRMLAGDVSVTNTITTQGMNTTLYTGNGSTQSVVTGIDMNTQWGNDASERFGGLVWIKGRSSTDINALFDTVKGSSKEISTNTTDAQFDNSEMTSFNITGFSLGTGAATPYRLNYSGTTYVSWNFQTTHRKSGTTNHGQPYECHYNPFTGFTIVKYTGSGTAGHEIPHHLGRKLGFVAVKNLSAVQNWIVNYLDGALNGNINLTSAFSANTAGTANDSIYNISDTSNYSNASTNQYILYGWANSFYDDKGVLNGNYEIGTYVGTGVAGNKVTTRGKPAWVMVKRLDSTGNWLIFDNKRTYYQALKANASDAEVNWATNILASDGFIVDGSNTDWNASGGTYLYMVVYDTNANGGGTYYPRATDTSNLQLTDAQLMYSDGYANGTAKNTSEVLSGMTYPAIAYSAGYNYVKKTSGGGYSATPYEPKFGEYGARSSANETPDIYIDGKWYSSASAPNLVTNGTFDSNTTGWNGVNSTLSVANGSLKVTVSGAGYAYATSTINTVIGKKYTVICSVSAGTVALDQLTFIINSSTSALAYIPYTTNKATFIADATTTDILFRVGGGVAATYAYIDNISVFESDVAPATPLGNITYLPIKVLADASGQIVSAESWKYPEVVVDMIKAREYEGLPIASPTKEGISKTSLLAEYTVTGSACTSIDFSGLDINTHKSYRVEIELTNATASATALYCFVNGDTTITNYWSQVAGGSNATYSGARNNSPIVLDLIASSRGFSCIFITKPSSYPAITGTYVKLDTSSISEYLVGAQKTATVTNITQLTFTATVASAIGVGSKIRIYRGDV